MGSLGWERWAWCVGFVFDAFALWVIWPGGSWPVVLLSRALGVPLQPLVSWLARTRHLPVQTVGYLTLLYTIVTVALMAIPAIEFGGLTSPYVFSLVSFAMAAPLVADLRRSRLFALFASWFVTWTALLRRRLSHPPRHRAAVVRRPGAHPLPGPVALPRAHLHHQHWRPRGRSPRSVASCARPGSRATGCRRASALGA